MQPARMAFEDVEVEVAGGWVIAQSDPDLPDEMPIRLDDGRTAMCLVDGLTSPGDRVYRVLYASHHLRGGRGVEIRNVTTSRSQTSCSPIFVSAGSVYLLMAAVPLLVMAALSILLVLPLPVPSYAIATMMACVAGAALIPVLMWINGRRIANRENGRIRSLLGKGRCAVDEVVAQDVASWKSRLDQAMPGHDLSGAGPMIRGSSCRVVDGIASVNGSVPRILLSVGHVRLPLGAISRCGLADGDMAHAIVPYDDRLGTVFAVSNPINGMVWIDPDVVGGVDAQHDREAIRMSFGKATWKMISDQWDELGRRRRMSRNA